MIHKCNDNDTVIHFNIVDGEIKELLVKSIGDKSWIVIGYKDLQLGLEKVFNKQEKEIDLKKYEPEKWFNYNVDCQEQYEAIYKLKSKSKMNDRYYIDKLTYEVGEVVLYHGKKYKIVHIHEDGLMNLEDGWFYIFGCHPNMFYKINASETIT